jgi:hypothetical protein
MPREQLLGLAADVDRLLAAGVAAAGGDSLRRRGKTIRELGAKVPALVPVADAVERVIGADKPGPAFLDLLVMTRQVRGSLAATGVEGPLTPLTEGGAWKTPVPVRELQPVYEALTQVGAGRDERIKDAAARKLFADLRLTTALLEALDDGYPLVADAAAEQGLPSLGDGVLADLRTALNLDGKAEDARRLRAICRIDPKAGVELCRRALAEGSSTLRVEALTRLPEVAGADEAEKEGLKYLRDKSRDVRVAAIRSLGAGESDEALSSLLDALDDKEDAVRLAACTSLASVRHPRATERLLAELRGLLPILQTSKPKKAPAKAKGAKKTSAAAPKEKESAIRRASFLVEALGKRKDGDRRAVARAILPLSGGEYPGLGPSVVAALGSMGPAIPEVVPALADAVAGKDGKLASCAISVLGEFPPAERDAAVPALASFAENGKGHDHDRIHALEILCLHADGHREEVLRAARAALADRNFQKNYKLGWVLGALKKIGPRAKPLLPDVFNALRNLSEKVFFYGTEECQEVICGIDPEGKEAIPELIGMLGQKKIMPQWIALFVLSSYGPKAREAAPAVERLTASKDRHVQAQAEQTLDALLRPA